MNKEVLEKIEGYMAMRQEAWNRRLNVHYSAGELMGVVVNGSVRGYKVEITYQNVKGITVTTPKIMVLHFNATGDYLPLSVCIGKRD